VTREGTRLTAALIVAALVAVLLAACGDSSDSGSDSASGGGGDEMKATSVEWGKQQGRSSQDGGADGGSEDEEAGGGSSDKPDPADVTTPLRVSGGGSGQFIVKGGDNSIQEFGEEGEESELQETAETVHAFYVARASGDWSGACSYMSESLREQLEQLASKSSVKGCAPFLEAFTSKLPDSVWREISTIDAASLRHDGEQAFLIYRGAKNEVYAMPMNNEDGEWRVAALSASMLGL
jgi:hypothetical protein